MRLIGHAVAFAISLNPAVATSEWSCQGALV
jgi:hypothetical protein